MLQNPEQSQDPANPEHTVSGASSPEVKKGDPSIVEKAIERIGGAQAEVAEALGLDVDSKQAVAETDDFLVVVAERPVDGSGNGDNDALETALIAGALEEQGLRISDGENPIGELEDYGLGKRINAVVEELHESAAELPDHTSAAEAVATVIEELEEHPVMEGTPGIEYIDRDHAIAETEAVSRKTESDLLTGIAGIDTIDPDGTSPGAQAVKRRLEGLLSELPGAREAAAKTAGEEYDARTSKENAAKAEVAEFEARVDARMASNEAPWLVDGEIIPRVKGESVKVWTEWLKEREAREPQTGDIYTIPLGIDKDSVDYDLLKKAGIDEKRITGHKLTRAELQSAGVFFVNRIGGGEKSIIAGTIPDPENPGQSIDFSQRAFLTRKELQTVYDYQQENGMGLQGESLDQVRTDMFVMLGTIKMEGLMTNAGLSVELRGNHRGGMLLERSGKLAGHPSPFVDQGFIFDGNNPDVLVELSGGVPKRLNMVNVHLPGAHPDFPGLSEMGSADWDQDYMTTADYVQEFYPKEPTREEAGLAEKYKGMTQRERVWSRDLTPPVKD